MIRARWTAALEGAMLKIRLQLTAATDPNPSRRRSAAAARKTTREAAMAAQASKHKKKYHK